MENVFKKDLSEYTRLNDPVQVYIEQAATALSKKNGYSVEENKKLVKHKLSKSNIKNPEVTFLETDENGDKHVIKDSLRDYINHIRKDEIVVVPSLTTYVHPSIKKSIHANFLDTNIALRKSDKKNAFKFKQLGDNDKFIYFNTLQKTRKIFNNSLSGAYASKSTILYSASAHYSLTSTTRVVASIGNAITESIVAGNKQYKDPDVTYNFLLTIISNTDDSVIKTIDKYSLYKPTPEEVLTVIKRSSDHYWLDEVKESKILELLKACTHYELANILYNNDLWDMMLFNDSLVKDLIDGMADSTILNIDNPKEILDKADPGILNLAYHTLSYKLAGVEINFNKLDNETLVAIASCVINTNNTLKKYNDLIRTFFMTNILPPTVGYIKDMLRDCIVLSDTDSTCGSYDQWIKWRFGDIVFNEKAVAFSAAVMTINTQVMDHYIKTFAGRMNVDKGSMDVLAMKNEYFWDVFVCTNVSKHYFANVKIQEGNVFAKSDLELKGVHLIASKASKKVRDIGVDMMLEILRTVGENKKIKLHDLATRIADLEREIIKDIENGNIDIYDLEKIKEENAYKLEAAKSPYLHHMLWEEVFSAKYGVSNQPQYMVLKIPTILDRRSRVEKFISEIEDIEIKTKLDTFLKKFKKDSLGTFRVPLTVAAGDGGIPTEILQVVDKKRVILTSLNMLYIIITSIGLYRKDNLLLSEMGY